MSFLKIMFNRKMEKWRNENSFHSAISSLYSISKTSRSLFISYLTSHISFLKSHISILIILLCLSSNLLAQQNNVPLNRQGLLNIEKHLHHPDNSSHTNVKPFIESVIQYDSIVQLEFKLQKRKNRTSWLGRKLKQESFIFIDTSDFRLSVDPLFNFTYNKDLADDSPRADTTHFYTNTRGLAVRGDIGTKISFETSFYENQSYFVNYINNYVKKHGVVPGQGRVKPFKGSGFDYAMASGTVSFSPFQRLNLQFGHGKNFIGEGYRSLLLSDNSFNYPFLKINSRFAKNKLQYTNIFASLQSLERMAFTNAAEALFVRKSGSFHYLSWNVYRRLQIGFFEGIIWEASRNTYPKSVAPTFYVPLIFMNSLLLQNDTTNKVLLGANFKFKVFNKIVLYGQLVVDDFKKSRYGYQGGFKAFDLFKIKNLYVQGEYNSVNPYTYAHQVPLHSYSHYNQALAHPLGANFQEMVGIASYSFKDLFIKAKLNYITYMEDGAGSNHGGDIFKSHTDISGNWARPLGVILMYQDVALGYVINRKTNMNLTFGITNRYYNNEASVLNNQIVYFAFRTSLFNSYYDF